MGVYLCKNLLRSLKEGKMNGKEIKEILKKNSGILKKSEHALERETLRINKKGGLSRKLHPEIFGSALTNKFISTDFAEPQLELITPVFQNEAGVFEFMRNLYGFVSGNLKNEYLWPFSMPCLFQKNEKIPLAEYGLSEKAIEKKVYRHGLEYRYGGKMQTISGIHYNFSLNDELIQILYKKFAQKREKYSNFKSNLYFRMIRNFLEITWLDTYLYGANPAVDESYFDIKPGKELEKLNKKTIYGPYAASLRMSRYGYCCDVQRKVYISCRNLDEYIRDLREAINTPHKKYADKKLQLNANILQIPNEYYAAIRPKQRIKRDENMLENLEKNGVRYLEIRTVDIDPFTPEGINRERLMFLHLAMIYCLIKDDTAYSKEKNKENIFNQDKAALFGRKPGFKLKKNSQEISMEKWGKEILSGMKEAAKILDTGGESESYQKIMELNLKKINDSELTPSAAFLKILKDKKTDFADFGLKIARKNKQTAKKPAKSFTGKMLKESEDSVIMQKHLEFQEKITVKGYEKLETSTQILIKEALKRGVKVKVLDESESFIELKKGSIKEYVKQGNKTSKDSYIAFLIMENKVVSKIILKECGISVPEGGVYPDIDSALKDYARYEKKKTVIKPKSTNYGIGINFVEPGNRENFKSALTEAFQYDKEVIVEDFFRGREFRIMVIGAEVEGITFRTPAMVTGDGKNTIKELVHKKNLFRLPETLISLKKIEKEFLKKQKLNIYSVPKKGRKVFLRQNTNVSTGGDYHNYTDKVHESYKDLAVKAAKAVNANICGVDMIITNIDKKASPDNYSVIELNFNPALKIHKFFPDGTDTDVEKAVLDLLGLK